MNMPDTITTVEIINIFIIPKFLCVYVRTLNMRSTLNKKSLPQISTLKTLSVCHTAC